MNRRGFLGSILALGAAPAIVRAASLMPVRSRLILPGEPEWVMATRSLTLEQLADVFPPPVLRLYGEPPPGWGEAPGRLLAEVPMNGYATSGTLRMHGEADVHGTGLASRVALELPDGTRLWRSRVGHGPGQFSLDNPFVSAGQVLTVTSFNLTADG